MIDGTLNLHLCGGETGVIWNVLVVLLPCGSLWKCNVRGKLSLGMILGLVSILLNTLFVDYIKFQRINMLEITNDCSSSALALP